MIRSNRLRNFARKPRANRSLEFRTIPVVASLENRQLLAVPGDLVPGQLYTEASWYDSNGDTVEVKVINGSGGFTVALEGGAINHADVDTINLIGLADASSLIITVTPNELHIEAGPPFNRMFTSGYTNVRTITSIPDPNHPAAPISRIEGIQLSAALVANIGLSGVSIGNVSLDTGMTAFVDRVNTTTINQTLESGMYLPVTGLIDMGGIKAANIGSIVIDGVISAKTGNPNDPSQTNDFQGVIEVSGSIGSVVGLHSSLNGTIRAGTIGTVKVAAITGEIATPGDLAINLPAAFKGLISIGGHLNAGFPLADGKTMTGQIMAGGGISGIDPSVSDPLLFPDGFAGVVVNTSPVRGVANIVVDGIAAFRMISASSIGDITANEFTKLFNIEATTSIGRLESYLADLAGSIRAGTDIGDLKSALNVKANLIAGRNIGMITGVTGGISSEYILAGGDIAGIDVVQVEPVPTVITARGDLGDVHIRAGNWTALTKARKIGNITVDSGRLMMANFVSETSIGNIYVMVDAQQAILGGSFIAGTDIGFIEGYAHIGTSIFGALIQAGGHIAGVKGVAYGNIVVPPMPPGPVPPPIPGAADGIASVQIIGNSIGKIIGMGYLGRGIADSLITSTSWDIESIEGYGNGIGMTNLKVNAAENIGRIEGRVSASGIGIDGSTFSTDYGDIGEVIAQSGPLGGTALFNTNFDVAGTIGTIAAISNEDAISGVKADAGGFGTISVLARGGDLFSGITFSNFRSYTTGFGIIDVETKSLSGAAIDTSTFISAAGIGEIVATSYGGSTISGGIFDAVLDIGKIVAESRKSGPAIDTAKFTSRTGSIGKVDGITAIARGGDITANALSNSEFRAAVDIGAIKATAFGGTAISNSKFLADSDKDNIGRIWSIEARAEGRNLISSSGIVMSEFTGTAIGPIDARVTTVEGGSAISGSTFTAVTAIYDGFGNFDNKGTIGPITVSNASMTGQGNGIDTSKFQAGSAGSIGDISVTVDLGIGIVMSTFDTAISDLDQNLFTSTIGNVSVTTSRTSNFTKNVAGIESSTFRSNAGIASIVVNSVGSGVNASTFNADVDHGGLGDIPGPIGLIRVSVPGRNASAVVMSSFEGASIGSITVKLEANATTAMDALRGSTFKALSTSIGDITVVNAGLGYAIADSLFQAVKSIGNVTVTGDVINTQFIVTNSTIGNVYVKGKADQSLMMQAEYFGNITFELLVPAKVTLVLPKILTMGNLTVSADGSASANLSLSASTLVQAGNIDIDGQLALASNLLNVNSMGTFKAGSIAAVTGNIGMFIGSTSVTSSIGAIVIGQASGGSVQNTFRFGSYAGNPDAIVGTASGNAKTGQGAIIGNIRFVLNQVGRKPAVATKKQPVPKPVKLVKSVARPLPVARRKIR
jgi:hypothetical protein